MKVWSVAKVNKERAIAMANKLEIPPLLAMMLDIRGITQEEDTICNNNNCTYYHCC